jgi:hypothetical protein
MQISVRLAFDEFGALRLLNWLARENAILLRQRPELPLLYDSGVIYRREQDETWCDYLNILVQGHEDCDGLAAARAGELLARGWQALRAGEEGYREALARTPPSILSEVYLRTSSASDGSGLYHCLVRYRIGGRWYYDDPSARLGMNGVIPAETRARWARELGVNQWRTQ